MTCLSHCGEAAAGHKVPTSTSNITCERPGSVGACKRSSLQRHPFQLCTDARLRVLTKACQCREMNLLTSQEVFAGPYLDDKEERRKFGEKFLDMTNGFLALPICLPGTAVWKGKQGRLHIISVLKDAAARSKANMKVNFFCYFG